VAFKLSTTGSGVCVGVSVGEGVAVSVWTGVSVGGGVDVSVGVAGGRVLLGVAEISWGDVTGPGAVGSVQAVNKRSNANEAFMYFDFMS